MSVEALIYDFETTIGEAIAQVLTNVDLKTLSVSSDPEFQKDRARCEVSVTMGASKGHLLVSDAGGSVAGTAHETMRECTVAISVITQANQLIHSAYRARIRNMCAFMNNLANAILQRHEILKFSDNGVSEYGHNDEEGLYKTVLEYDCDFGIIPAAFNEL